MRYTENRNGKWIIPKIHMKGATEKLARLEDVEEREAAGALIDNLRKAAKAKQQDDPATASLLRMAADIMVTIHDINNAQAQALRQGTHHQMAILLDYLDEIDGQIMDDPVSVIREKIEEVMG